MSKKENLKKELIPHLDAFLTDGGTDSLLDYIKDHSELPGRRANLELAAGFAELMAERALQRGKHLWELCSHMLELSPERAPVNTPGEFIPFCGIVGIGEIGAILPDYINKSYTALRQHAKDPRWRMREAVRMGLQAVMRSQPEETLEILWSWVQGGDLLEMRAAAAAVGAPNLLTDERFASSALQLHKLIFDHFPTIGDRKAESFRVLRKALGYTLSLVVVEIPEAGFDLIDELISSGDPDLIWIVKNNLKKNRLHREFPNQVEIRFGRV